MHPFRAKKTFLLVIFYFLLPSVSFSQTTFKAQLDNIIKQYKNSIKDSSLYFKALDELKDQYKDSLKICPYNYLLYKNIGAYYFLVVQDDNKAMASQKRVLQDQLKCLNPESPEIAITYFNIGQSLDFLGHTEEAEQYYFKVIDIQNKLTSPHFSTSNHFTEIGNFYSFRGDNAKAIFYFEKAEQTHIGPKNYFYRNLLRAKSMVLEKEESYEKAIEILKEALEVTRTLPNDQPIKEVRICDDISKQYRFLGDFSTAEKYIQEALKIAKQIPDIRPQDLNNLYNHYSHIKKEQGKYQEAINLLLKVKQSYLENAKTTKLNRISGNYENIGDVYFKQGKYEEALINYQEGMQILDNNLSSDYRIHPNIKNRQFIGESYLLRQLGLKAKALHALAIEKNEKDLFISTLLAVEKYDTLNRRLFKENWDEKSYLPVLKASRPYYQLGFDAAMHLYEKYKEEEYLAKAYSIVAKLKSQLLDRSIHLEELKTQRISESVLGQEKQLKDSILLKTKLYQNTLNATEEVKQKAFQEFSKYKIQLALFQKKVGIDKLVSENENINIPSISEIQKFLGKNRALLEFHLENKQLYSIYITNENIHIYPSQLTKEEVIAFYGKLSEGGKLENFLPGTLLENLSKSTQSELIIIPDQELLQIPFEGLYLNDSLLWIDKFQISYEYGSGFLFDKRNKNIKNNIAAFASDYSSSRFEHQNASGQVKKTSFSPLTHTVSEAETAQDIIGGKVFSNALASKSNFTQNLDKFGIFHFALHGSLNEEFPDQSALIFESEEGDYELSASEIYNLDIPAQLTVLSACNSGVGPVEIGDGVRSLTRSFIHSGSASVITSLWESSDASTQEILEKFYTYLKSGKKKSEALRLAKLEYIEHASPTFKHQKYWAHLILVGDSEAIFSANFMPKKFLFLAGLFLFILLLIWVKKTR